MNKRQLGKTNINLTAIGFVNGTIKILDILAEYFEAYTDQELAEKLGSTRNTISKWRFFNQIPNFSGCFGCRES